MNTQINGKNHISNLEDEIGKIRAFIEDQLHDKQELLRLKDRQIAEITNLSAKKDAAITLLDAKLKDLEHEADGNRQLINKLLGDISKLHNDIDWYRRTYEDRSFLGTIKEKIKRKL